MPSWIEEGLMRLHSFQCVYQQLMVTAGADATLFKGVVSGHAYVNKPLVILM